ncbi:hypothetical protein OGR47_14760 [Methylocystis sp. MJC1]|jgi:hypothetical protein|nr:hypothetical protein [Methylocystis sp. MJC1]KAF2990429.1 hypothetical protein MJC1_02528 [Methylocystis sp. MJC1]UZX11132.1 hypothetical protein OGR47_14760 [Methylocystis sp. MJC1]
MRKSLLFGLILLMVAASFASAGALFKSPAEAEADFCFGYAICE